MASVCQTYMLCWAASLIVGLYSLSSGGSKSSTPLATSGPGLALSPTYNPVLALSPIYIALCRLPIVLIWLPQLGSSLQGYKHANQIGSRIATPALAPS